MRARVKKKNMYRYIAKTMKLKVCDEYTLIKKKKIFSSYVRNSEWSVSKLIYEEGLPTI